MGEADHRGQFCKTFLPSVLQDYIEHWLREAGPFPQDPEVISPQAMMCSRGKKAMIGKSGKELALRVIQVHRVFRTENLL